MLSEVCCLVSESMKPWLPEDKLCCSFVFLSVDSEAYQWQLHVNINIMISDCFSKWNSEVFEFQPKEANQKLLQKEKCTERQRKKETKDKGVEEQ